MRSKLFRVAAIREIHYANDISTRNAVIFLICAHYAIADTYTRYFLSVLHCLSCVDRTWHANETFHNTQRNFSLLKFCVQPAETCGVTRKRAIEKESMWFAFGETIKGEFWLNIDITGSISLSNGVARSNEEINRERN